MFKRNHHVVEEDQDVAALQKIDSSYYESKTTIHQGGMNLKGDSVSAKILSGSSYAHALQKKSKQTTLRIKEQEEQDVISSQSRKRSGDFKDENVLKSVYEKKGKFGGNERPMTQPG
mmetsp:Transcript_32049/g.31346  ORF Transcript_32049/g.31346 Transcript_32049/m.31346 type:complete len:117 (+) Transcript_32049:197-547(+)